VNDLRPATPFDARAPELRVIERGPGLVAHSVGKT
jgi:hypothetical protein